MFEIRRDWKSVTPEEAKKLPYYGLSGWLLVFYLLTAYGFVENLLIVFAPEFASYLGIKQSVQELAQFYHGNTQLSQFMLLLGAGWYVPFLVLAPLKHRLMPKVAIWSMWLWLIPMAVTWSPPSDVHAVTAAIIFPISLLLVTWYFLASKRVNVTYLHRVPAGFDYSLHDKRPLRTKIGHAVFWFFGGTILFGVIVAIIGNFVSSPERVTRSDQQADVTVRYSPRGSSDGTTDDGSKSADEVALERGNYATAFKNNLKYAEQGDSASQGNLANFYYLGLGVPRDFAKALYWSQKAAEQDNPAAQYLIGMMYAKGDGVPRNIAIAIEWWRKAADHGWPAAQYNLGLYYAGRSETNNVSPDPVLSFVWLELAALNYQKSIDSGLDVRHYLRDAIMARDEAGKRLSNRHLETAKKLISEWRITKSLK